MSLILAMLAASSCAVFSDGDTFQRRRLRPIDGLDIVEAPIPGVLELREHHHIGSYDALLIPDATLTYERGSERLTLRAERAFLGLLKRSIVEATEAAAIPVVEKPGPCVMEVRLRVSRLNLDVTHRADQLAEMTLVMRFRDSMSRIPLLRYAADHRVPNPMEGVTPDDQIRKGLDRIIAEMNIAEAMGSTGFADDEITPGCNGTLAARGRAARQQ